MTKAIGTRKPVQPINAKEKKIRDLWVKVKTSGAWAMTKPDDARQHFMVSSHPTAETAISLCWMRLQLVNTLIVPKKEMRCTLCTQFLTLRTEVKTKDNKSVYKIRRLNHPIHNQKQNRSK